MNKRRDGKRSNCNSTPSKALRPDLVLIASPEEEWPTTCEMNDLRNICNEKERS